jgi:hypothetical protein
MVKTETLAIAGLALFILMRKGNALQGFLTNPYLSNTPANAEVTAVTNQITAPIVTPLNVTLTYTGEADNQPSGSIQESLTQLAGLLPTSGTITAYTSFEAAAAEHGVGGGWTVYGSGGYYYPQYIW